MLGNLKTPEQHPPDVVALLNGRRHEFLAFVERRLGSHTLAEDVLQDAYARSLTKARDLQQAESARAWFYRLLRNAVTDHQRRAGASTRKLEALARELADSGEPQPVAVVCQCVGALAKALKPEYEAALQAVAVDGATVKDYAAAAGISANNAAVRVFRAREALRRRVKRGCGRCADAGCRDCTCQALAHSPQSSSR